jgi:antitoxin (DNA-binding transcriptional repressor) of toxin-antitoxin stability system
MQASWQNEFMSSITLDELQSDAAAVVKRVSQGEVILIEQDG